MTLQEDIFRLCCSLSSRKRGWPSRCCSHSMRCQSHAMPTDPWTSLRPLTLASIWGPCQARPCTTCSDAWPISQVRGGFSLASDPGRRDWPLAPTFSRPSAAGSESKQAAGLPWCESCFPSSHQENPLSPSSTPQAVFDIAPACRNAAVARRPGHTGPWGRSS